MPTPATPGVCERKGVALYYLIYFELIEDNVKVLATDAGGTAFISLLEQWKNFGDARLPLQLSR
jgi:hypothetical protein